MKIYDNSALVTYWLQASYTIKILLEMIKYSRNLDFRDYILNIMRCIEFHGFEIKAIKVIKCTFIIVGY